LKPQPSQSAPRQSGLDGIPRPAVVRPATIRVRPDRRNVAARETLLCRVRSEFDEMPGLSLTLAQASRLFALSPDVSSRILERLIGEGLLRLHRGGQYGRAGTEQGRASPSSATTLDPARASVDRQSRLGAGRARDYA
jgi:hypothetical protein